MFCSISFSISEHYNYGFKDNFIFCSRYFTIVRSPHRKYCTCSVAAVITLIWFLSVLSMIPTLLFDNVLFDKNLLTEKKLDLILSDNTVNSFSASLDQSRFARLTTDGGSSNSVVDTLSSFAEITTDGSSVGSSGVNFAAFKSGDASDIEQLGPSPECQPDLSEHAMRHFLLHVYVFVLLVVQFVVPVLSLIFIHTKISSYLVQVHLRSPPVDASNKRGKKYYYTY